MDIPTLLIVLATVLSLTSIALALTWRLNRGVPGLALWTLGHVVISVGILLMVTQDRWPALISIVVANMLIASGYGLSVAGTRAFFGRDPTVMWRLVPVVVLLGAGLAWFSLVAPSLSARVALASCLYAALCALSVREFHRHGGMAVLTSRYMMLVFALFAVAMTIRIVTTLTFPEGGIVLSGGPMEQMTFYNGIVQGILIALGYIILTTERLQQELRAQAALDPLTGIFNRRAFLETASAHVADTGTAPQPVAVLAIDLDHFKRLNDEFGHAVGDRVLQHFVATARRHLRKHDTLARFGGEEFIALLPGVSAVEAEVVAERLGRAFAGAPLTVNGQTVPATASIGVAHLAMDEGLEAVLKRADDALYAAKARGRNQVQRWDVQPGAPEHTRAYQRRATVAG